VFAQNQVRRALRSILIGAMRFLVGLGGVTLIVVACASDDDKKVLRGAEAGAGGESGETSRGAGGSSVNAAGAGGEPSDAVAGAGGDASSGGAGTAGETGGGGTAGETGGGAAGAAGEASAFCEGGLYYEGGESACWECLGSPQTTEVTCAQLSLDTRLVADGGPLWIDLVPPASLREPVAHDLTVSFRVGEDVTQVDYPGNYDHDNDYWSIDISADSSSAIEEVRVLPFTVRTACHDTFKLLDEVVFVQAEPNSDTYDLICPNQG
jgi:hypothetical protein